MSNTKSFAERELDILVKSSPDPDNRPVVEEFIPEILSLCEKFGNSGQCGGSAPYVASAITQALEKLLLQKPICSITGIDEEWNDVSSINGSIMYQNNRAYAVFKEGDKPYYLNAIVWKTPDGSTWSGSAWLNKGYYQMDDYSGKLSSRQYIKSFPFEPKTFYIDVIEEEVFPNDWEFYVQDPSQLDAVWEYYNRMPVEKPVDYDFASNPTGEIEYGDWDCELIPLDDQIPGPWDDEFENEKRQQISELEEELNYQAYHEQ